MILKAIAVGGGVVPYESELVDQLKSKLDTLAAETATINSFINEYKLAGGLGVNNYTNVNQWILRHYPSEGLYINNGPRYYSWWRIFPVIGNYIYCLKSFTENCADFYVILKQLVDISTPVKLNNFYKMTSTNYTNLSPVYNSSLSEDSTLELDEILVRVTTNGTFFSKNSITYISNINSSGNYYCPQLFALDLKYNTGRMLMYHDTNQNDVHYKFELVKAGKEENKYIQGLLVSPSYYTINSTSNGNIAKKTGITLLNNNVNLGEVSTEFTWLNNDAPSGYRTTYYINLNPLTVSCVYSG